MHRHTLLCEPDLYLPDEELCGHDRARYWRQPWFWFHQILGSFGCSRCTRRYGQNSARWSYHHRGKGGQLHIKSFIPKDTMQRPALQMQSLIIIMLSKSSPTTAAISVSLCEYSLLATQSPLNHTITSHTVQNHINMTPHTLSRRGETEVALQLQVDILVSETWPPEVVVSL